MVGGSASAKGEEGGGPRVHKEDSHILVTRCESHFKLYKPGRGGVGGAGGGGGRIRRGGGRE